MSRLNWSASCSKTKEMFFSLSLLLSSKSEVKSIFLEMSIKTKNKADIGRTFFLFFFRIWSLRRWMLLVDGGLVFFPFLFFDFSK